MKKGFTLVELIVVIAIIAILSALAVPRVEDFVDDAREVRRQANFRTVYTAVSAGLTKWIADNGNVYVENGSFYQVTQGILGNESTYPASEKLDNNIQKLMPANFVAVGDSDENLMIGLSDDELALVDSMSSDDDESTWGIVIHVDLDEIKDIIITNEDYISINGDKPTKAWSIY